MSADNFQRALSLVLDAEGGFVDDPHDPGGATNFGVTQTVYDRFRSRQRLARRSVRAITPAEVSAIYRVQYWDAVRGDELPPGVDYAAFDAAVNSGVVRASRWLQAALPVAPVDGHVGLITLEAARRCTDGAALVARFCALRLTFLQRLGQWLFFGKGWSNRIRAVRAAAQAMAAARPYQSAPGGSGLSERSLP